MLSPVLLFSTSPPSSSPLQEGQQWYTEKKSPEKCQNEIYTDNLNEQQDKHRNNDRTRKKRLYKKDFAPYRRDRVPVFQPPHQRLQRLVFVGQTARERV